MRASRIVLVFKSKSRLLIMEIINSKRLKGQRRSPQDTITHGAVWKRAKLEIEGIGDRESRGGN